MPRVKITMQVKVRITGEGCQIDDRLLWPGETATVPADVAARWINEQRAVEVAAEVKHGNW